MQYVAVGTALLAAVVSAWNAWANRKQGQTVNSLETGKLNLGIGALTLESLAAWSKIQDTRIASLEDEVARCHSERDGLKAELQAQNLLP